MKMTIWDCREDHDAEDMEIPAKFAVCERCEGHGKHGNEAFDGLSLEWFREQGDEFVENYFSGRYDVRCSECNGDRVVKVADEDAMTQDQREAYESYMQFLADEAYEERMRQRYQW